MALVANLTQTGVSEDGTLTTFADSTVYGGANPDRNEVAVFITAYKVDEDLNESALVVSAFNPESDTSFVVTNSEDGWQKINFVIVENYNIATTYSKYDLVWDTTQNAFYEYINNTPSAGFAVTNPLYFSVVADPCTKIANVGTVSESGNLVYQVYQKVLDYQTAKCYGNVMITHAKESCSDDCDCGSPLEKSKRRIHTLLTVMRLANTRQMYLEGERAARLAATYCADCGC